MRHIPVYSVYSGCDSQPNGPVCHRHGIATVRYGTIHGRTVPKCDGFWAARRLLAQAGGPVRSVPQDMYETEH